MQGPAPRDDSVRRRPSGSRPRAGVLSPPSHTNAAPESHPAAPLTRPSLENVQRSYSDATVILLTPKLSTN